MKRLVIAAAVTLMLQPLAAFAAEGGDWHMPKAPDLEDKPSLQRGVQLYVNYCLGCHSLKFQRYERTADDLEIPHEIFSENLIFTGQKIGDLMQTAMPTEAAKAWFGAAPPDLTMVAKVRGSAWIYNYLRMFYVDDTRPLGVNNKVFPNVGMPHALLTLQGIPVEVPRQVPKMSADGYELRDPLVPGKAVTEEKMVLDVVEGTGTLSPAEYDEAVYDITNFLYYVAEPARIERERLGVYVLLFLVILYVFTALLGREYSKEIR
jgi:cytochrome c1